MVVVPAVIPVTILVAVPIVATEVLLLAHVPPAVASLKVLVAPVQALGVPLIALGDVFTVTTVVVLQLPVVVYVMVVVPAATGVTIPVFGSMVALVVVLLLHVPPVVASLKVEV